MRTVRRAYVVNDLVNKKPQRVLVDGNLIFYPGDAWSTLKAGDRLVFLPGETPYHDWWEGWWESNWKLIDWSWCYGFKESKRA